MKFPFATVTLAKMLILRGYFGAADEVIAVLEHRGVEGIDELVALRKEAKLERLLRNIKKRKSDGLSRGTEEDN